MKEFLISMLREMERLIPPPEKCHHALTYARFGTDPLGWEDKLALQINYGGVFHAFFLDDEDLQKPHFDLADEIFRLVHQPEPNAQLGVGFGQYS